MDVCVSEVVCVFVCDYVGVCECMCGCVVGYVCVRLWIDVLMYW